MTDRQSLYESEMGKPPPLDDSESAWQWSYRGTSEDRERLLELIQDEAEAEHAEQMSLL